MLLLLFILCLSAALLKDAEQKNWNISSVSLNYVFCVGLRKTLGVCKKNVVRNIGLYDANLKKKEVWNVNHFLWQCENCHGSSNIVHLFNYKVSRYYTALQVYKFIVF